MTVIGEAFIKVRPDTDNFERESRGSILSGMATLGKLGAAAFAGAAVAGGAIGVFGLKVAAANESAAQTFTTLLGDATKAGDYLKELQAFAANTPFEFPELRDAASKFLAVGLEANRVIPIMTTLGDATSAMGTGSEGIDRATRALTQMSQKGKVSAEEMLQLTEAGIPAWDALAAVLGTDVAGAMALVTEGGVQAESVFTALETNAGPALQRLSGMMEVQAQTLSGMFSTLKDNVQLALGDMMAGAVPIIKDKLPEVTAAITEGLDELGPEVAKVLGGLADLVGPLVDALAPLAGAFLDVFGGVLTALEPILTAVGDMVTEMRPVFSQIGTIMAQLGPPIATIATLFGQVFLTALETVLPIISSLVDAVTPLISSLASGLLPIVKRLAPVLGRLGEVIGDSLVTVLETLAPLLPDIAELFAQIVEAAAPLIASLVTALLPVVQQLAPVFANLAVTLGSAFLTVLESLAPILPQLATAFADIAVAVGGALADAVLLIVPPLAEMATTILTALAPSLPDLTAALVALVEAFLPLLPVITDLVLDILPPLTELLVAVVPLVAELATVLAEALVPIIGILVEAFAKYNEVLAIAWGWILDVARVIVENLQPAFDAVSSFVTETVVPMLSDLWHNYLEPIAEFIGGGLAIALAGLVLAWDGITSAVGWVIEAVKTVWKTWLEPMATWFADTLDGALAIAEMAFGFIAGAVGGVITKISDLWDNYLKKIVTWIKDKFESGIQVAIDILGGFKDVIDDIIGFLSKIIGWLDKVIGKAKDAALAILGIGEGTTGSIVPRDQADRDPTFHSGGVVPGLPGTEVPAVLLAGETVRTVAQEAALQRGGRGGFGSAVHIEHAEFYDGTDAESVAQVVMFKLAAA